MKIVILGAGQVGASVAESLVSENDDITIVDIDPARLQALQDRLAQHECALAKLDERTLSAAMRAARRKSGPDANDPCRLNSDTPVQLSSNRDD